MSLFFFFFENSLGTSKGRRKVQRRIKHGSCLPKAYSLGEQNAVTGRPVELQGGHTTIPDTILKSDPATVKFTGSGIQQVWDPALPLAQDNPSNGSSTLVFSYGEWVSSKYQMHMAVL